MIRPVNAEKINLNLAYKPGFIHPEFAPYEEKKKLASTPNGRKELTDGLDSTQIRAGKSYTFKALGNAHTGQYCPANFTKVPDAEFFDRDAPRSGYVNKRNAYICVYDKTKEVDRTKEARIQKSTPQSSFDMRSLNPYTGEYDIYFKSKNACTTQKYSLV
jgi:hypothetical protein